MQRNWIGRSEGARVKFALEGDPSTQIEVFTTRIDTIFGATFVLLGPGASAGARRSPSGRAIRRRCASRRRRSACRTARRASAARSRSRASTPAFRAINPFTNEPVPIWVANFVLGEYGTGAVMAVPAHDQRDFEFARKFNLPIRVVVTPDGKPASADALTEAAPTPTARWSTPASSAACRRKRRRSR